MVRFPHIPVGAPVVVSATQYTTYLQCPDQARARAHGIYGEDSKPALRGMLAHRIFYRHLSDGAISESDFEEVCRQEIGGHLNHKMNAVGITKPSTLRPLVAEVQALYEKFRTVSVTGFEGAEEDLLYEMDNGVTLRGTIDAVFRDDAGIRLVDWKTGGLGAAEQQLGFYSVLWWLAKGQLPMRVEATSVMSGDQFSCDPRDMDLDNVAAEIATLVAAIRSTYAADIELERRAGPQCRWCPILDACSEGRAAVAVNG